MNVIISARHCEIPHSLREATERRIARLRRYHPRLADAEVIYDREHIRHEVEIRLLVEGANPVIARGTGETFDVALDVAADRVSRQLKRGRERWAARRLDAPAR